MANFKRNINRMTSKRICSGSLNAETERQRIPTSLIKTMDSVYGSFICAHKNERLRKNCRSYEHRFNWNRFHKWTRTFIDVLVTTICGDSMKMLVYQKPSHKGQLLSFNINDPNSHKRNCIRKLTTAVNYFIGTVTRWVIYLDRFKSFTSLQKLQYRMSLRIE